MRPCIAVAPLALLAVTGCVHEAETAVEPPAYEPAPAGDGVVEHQVTVTPEDVGADARPATLRDPIPFQIGAGYGALSRIDLDGCRERGLPSGYVRVRATFTRVGYVVRASVTSATAPPAPALDCIADRLRQAGVPAFDGRDARLSKTYFVEPTE